MEENQSYKHNGGGSGFWFGVIVGVVVTLLFTTKKGREIFRDLTEKGLDKFSDLQESLDRREAEFEEFQESEENDYVEPELIPQEKSVEPPQAQPERPKQEVRHLAKEESPVEKPAAKENGILAQHAHKQTDEPPSAKQSLPVKQAEKKKRIIPRFFNRGVKKN